MKEISLREYATSYNTVLNRRGKPMGEGYLYRLIRQNAGLEKTEKNKKKTRELWFKYKFTGDKDRIKILV